MIRLYKIYEFISFQEAIKNNSHEGPPKFPNLPVSNWMQYRDPFVLMACKSFLSASCGIRIPKKLNIS